MSRKPYPTDLTDEQWERLDPMLPSPRSGAPKGGRPVTVDRREVVNAIFYHLRAGGSRRMLPHDLPAWQTVYGLFRDWRLAGGGTGPTPCCARRSASKPASHLSPK